MAYYEMMPAGLPAGLQSGMDSVLNKKFGTATSYAPGTWPDTVNLMGPLPEKTVSGSIAHITDGADDVPIKSWEVEIAPTLTGKSAIEATQTGKNLFDVGTQRSDYNRGQVINVSDGVVSFEIYSSGNTFAYRNFNIDAFGEFSISAITSKKGGRILVHIRNKANTAWLSNSDITITGWNYNAVFGGWYKESSTTEVSQTINIPNENASFWQLGLGFANTYVTVGDTETFEDIMVEVGSTATTYEPYTAPTVSTVNLGRTIYGGTADVVNGTCEPINWLDNALTTQTVNGTTFTVNADKSITVSNTPTQQTRVYISQEAITINEAMFFSFGTMPTGTRVFCSRTSGGSTTYPTISPSHTATLDATYTNFLLEIGTSFDGTPFTLYPMCNKGSTASDYSPYFEPFTFTPITPTPETKLGTNNFWADAGDSTVVYRADIDALISSLSGNRGIMMARPQLEELSKAETEETEEKEANEDSPEVLEK